MTIFSFLVLIYNYKDEVAQAYCSVVEHQNFPDPNKHYGAVRRNCDDPTCHDLCGQNSTFAASMVSAFSQVNGFNCVGGLWFWMEHPILSPNPGPGQTDAGSLNMVTISYDHHVCSATGCEPNYCCCMAFPEIG